MAQQITKCTGCGAYSTESLGVNKNGEPYLACCPDSDYKPMAQQTAVDWLENKIDDLLELYPSEREKVNEVIEQAKQMEREQIEKAHYISGCYMCHDDDKYERAQQYYNETYGK